VPVFEQSWPTAKSRKFLVRKELNVALREGSPDREWMLWVLASAVKEIRIVAGVGGYYFRRYLLIPKVNYFNYCNCVSQ
jgi:hypothetical protein